MAGHFTERLSCNLVTVDELLNRTVSICRPNSGFNLNPMTVLTEDKTFSLSGIKSGTVPSSRDALTDDENVSFNDNNCYGEKFRLRSIFAIRRELPESTLGWPLLERTRRSKARSMLVVEWIMSRPGRSSSQLVQLKQTNSGLNETNFSFSSKTDGYFVEDCSIGDTTTQEIITGTERKSSDESSSIGDKNSGSFSTITKESAKSRLGWPLLGMKACAILDDLKEYEARDISADRQTMSSPDRSTPANPKSQIGSGFREAERSVDKESCCYEYRYNDTCLPAPPVKLPNKKFDLVVKLISSGCRRFSYDELNKATNQFSSGMLIGEGGCSNVYKGIISSGKQVAVKVLKQYNEAWNDFSLEVDIMSLLKHKYITPLIGVCIENNDLILVSDFLPKGSLEENLQGQGKKSVLPWNVRFKVAVAVAEALNYLHHECSPPVIHRDVKPSNILLSKKLQPQLSDFGLAIWGGPPEDSTHVIHSDVVGTFGYLAPEYFMHGMASDKIDVYAFGVILLELVTGKKAIFCSENLTARESLVKWATPLLESGNVEALLDRRLDGNFDIDEMHRMVLAATHCTKKSARLRPKVSEVLQLLRGEKDEKVWVNSYVNNNGLREELDNMRSVDDLLLEFDHKPCSNFTINDAVSESSLDIPTDQTYERRPHLKLKDYLKEPQA